MTDLAKIYRGDMPPVPERMRDLPIQKGMPVPWFVQWIEDHYDFRVVDSRKFAPAIQLKLCWICGKRLGSALAFTIGPMCAINRTISEPPSHRECAEFSVVACPFLNQTETRRNETRLPEGTQHSEYGLKRQPGAICIWITKKYRPFRAGVNELLFEIGEPDQIFWFCEGRPATRSEVLRSIETGLPSLEELAKIDGPVAIRELKRRSVKVYDLLPPAESPKVFFGSAARRRGA